MAHFPGSPPTLKGALVSVDIPQMSPTIIAFQYNPATLTRSLEVKAGEGGPAGYTLSAPPVETISVEIELDATDGLDEGDSTAEQLGIHPQLAALEQLLYPSSGHVIANQILAATGVIEVLPPVSTLTLFIWGKERVLPVALTSCSVTEEAHDTALNPIRARVSLSMRVLSYHDLSVTHPANALFLAHQMAQEAMA